MPFRHTIFAISNGPKMNHQQNNDPLYKLTICEFKSLLNGDLKSFIEDVLEHKFSEMMNEQDEITLDVDGAAKMMNVSRQTVYQNIKEIPHRKVFGKLVFFKEELLKFIDQNGTANNKK